MSSPDQCSIPCYKADVVARLREAMPTEPVLHEMARLFGLSLPATSHQLRRLRDAGVVTFRNDGRMAYYRLEDGFLAGLMVQARVRVEQMGRHGGRFHGRESPRGVP